MQVSVFVSCGKTMELRMQQVRSLVADLNPRWQTEHDIAVRVLSFADVPSTYAQDGPQSAINAEFFGQYDIYLGLMGHRFGTPTPGWGSGTEEEYRLAVAEHRAHRPPQHVAFGFSEEPVNPFEIDAGELALVQAFRASLGVNQIYFTWNSKKQFIHQVTNQLNAFVYRIAQKPVIGGARYRRDPRVS